MTYLFSFMCLMFSIYGLNAQKHEITKDELYKKISKKFDENNILSKMSMLSVKGTRSGFDFFDSQDSQFLSYEAKNNKSISKNIKGDSITTITLIKDGKLIIKNNKNKKKTEMEANGAILNFGSFLSYPNVLNALQQENTTIKTEIYNKVKSYKITQKIKNVETIFYIDIKTFNILCQEIPNAKIYYDDYKKIKGLWFPTRNVMSILSMEKITQIQEIELFEKIDESLFVI